MVKKLVIACVDESERLIIISEDIQSEIGKGKDCDDLSLVMTDEEVILFTRNQLYSIPRNPSLSSSSISSFSLQQSIISLSQPITHVSASLHFVVFSTENELWSYGMNQINPERSSKDREEPRLELVSDKIESRITTISTGYYHTLIVNERGNCYSFGRGGNGQLGLGICPNWISFPQKIAILGDETVIAVSAGSHHSIFLTQHGSVLSCGSSSFYRLGFPDAENLPAVSLTNSENCLIPSLVDDLEGVGFVPFCQSFSGIKLISCNVWHSVAISHHTNDLYTWGYSKYGQFGRSDEEFYPRPTRMTRLDEWICQNEEQIVSVVCGSRFIALLTSLSRLILIGTLSSPPVCCSERTESKRDECSIREIIFETDTQDQSQNFRAKFYSFPYHSKIDTQLKIEKITTDGLWGLAVALRVSGVKREKEMKRYSR